MSTIATTSVVDIATLFPASLIGTALARLWVADSLQSLLVPALDDGGAGATCPITLAPIEHPVLLADGFVYEEAEICKWLQNHAQAPCTNATLEHLCVLRLSPLRSAIEYFLLRSASNLESRNVSCLRQAMADATQTDTPMSTRVHRLQSALSQAQAASEALSSGIADARILLVKLSAELGVARKTALVKVEEHLKFGLLRTRFCTWHQNAQRQSRTAAGRLQRWWRRHIRAKKEAELARQRDIPRAVQQGYAVPSTCAGTDTTSPAKQSTLSVESLAALARLAGTGREQDSPGFLTDAYDLLDSPGCPFSINKVSRQDVRDGDQSCASCGASEVLLFGCSRCQGEQYCSFHCQRRRWPVHKADCRKSGATQMDSGDVQIGQTVLDKQVGQTIGFTPGSSQSSRAPGSSASSRDPVPSSSQSSRDPATPSIASATPCLAPTTGSSREDKENLQESSRELKREGSVLNEYLQERPQVLPTPQESCDAEGSAFGSLFALTDSASTVAAIPYTELRVTPQKVLQPADGHDGLPPTVPCSDCNRHFWKRPPGGLCDDCFRSNRGSLSPQHCLAYCKKCDRVIDKVLDPMGRSSCAYCYQIVEPTCAAWRENLSSLMSPATEARGSSWRALSPTKQRESSPVGRLDVEPPRVERNLNTLLADLEEEASNSPLEPHVAAAYGLSLANEGIPDSPQPLLKIPVCQQSEHVQKPGGSGIDDACGSNQTYPRSPSAGTIRTRVQQLQQESGLAGTGNLVSDVRGLAAEFAIPFTTLSDVVASCEAALGDYRKRTNSPEMRRKVKISSAGSASIPGALASSQVPSLKGEFPSPSPGMPDTPRKPGGETKVALTPRGSPNKLTIGRGGRR